MLAPDTRAILLNELRPPPGCFFDAAVATTFTLDLTATLVPALAFSSFSFSGHVPDPVAALESLRRTSERLDVFCQGGNIGVPTNAPDLVAFLEPMVHEVRRPPRGGLFHPKVWFVRYVDAPDGAKQYRLLVLSRNLTNDSSWDAIVVLNSVGVETKANKTNRPLADFLRSLPDRCIRDLDASRRQRVEELAYEAARVVWELPDGANDLAFHFLDSGRKNTLDLSGGRHLVISPFVTDEGLTAVDPHRQIAVVSRAEELEKLAPESIERLDCYVIDSMLGVGSIDEDTDQTTEEPAAGQLGQLHAKAYVIEPDNGLKKNFDRLILGSANATLPALRNNTEFLVEFTGHRRNFGVDAFLGPDAPFRSMIEAYQPTGGARPDPLEDEQRRLENVLRRLAEIPHALTVAPTDESRPGTYDVTVQAGADYGVEAEWTVQLELLTRRGMTPIDGRFTSVPTADVTPFLVVQLTSPSGLIGSTVVVATLNGDPAGRLDEVLARQVDTPEKFLRFLYLLLSFGDPAALAALSAQGSGDGVGFTFLTGGSGILELIVRALAESPAAIIDLDRLVDRLRATEGGKKVLPDGFDELWTVVLEAQSALAGDPA